MPLDRYTGSGPTVTPTIRDKEEDILPVPTPGIPRSEGGPASDRFQAINPRSDADIREAEQASQVRSAMLGRTSISPASPSGRPGFGQIVSDAISQEWMGSWALRQMGGEDYDLDPDFALDRLEKPQHDRIFGGLSTEEIETYGNMLEEAVSYEHARSIRRRIDDLREIEGRLADAGAVGVAARVGAAIFDPVAIGVTLATEGMAAPLVWGGKISRVQRAVRAGLLAGTANAGIEGFIASQDPLRGVDDVAIAGAAGMVLGGTVGAAFGRSPAQVELDTAMARAGQRAIDEMTVEQGMRSGLTPTEGNAPSFMLSQTQEDGEIVNEIVQAGRIEGETVEQGGGSTGAMLNPVMDDFLSETDEELLERARRLRPNRKDVWGQFDMYSQLARSEHPMVAQLADMLSPNPSGVRTSGRAQDATAWEIATNVYNTRMTQVNRSFNNAFSRYMKEQGEGWWNRFVKREEFARAVGKAVRDPNSARSQAVSEAADEIRRVNKSLLEDVKRVGARGFDEVDENANYLMRVHSLERLTEVRRKFGDATVNNMLARSIMKGSGMADEEFDTADRLARTYLRTLDRSGWNVDMGTATMFSNDQREWLAEAIKKELGDAGEVIDDQMIEDMLYTVQRSGDGRTSRAKRRLRLDESFRMRVTDPKTGQETTLGVEDILEDNAEVIMNSYVRQMGGIIGMAEKGFKGANDYDNFVNRTRRTAQKAGMTNPQKLEEQLAIAETMKRGVMGQPLTDLHKFASMRRVGRALRDYNFARVMGQVGFAQVAEIGTVVGQMGFRATLSHVPALGKVFRRMRNGELDDDLARELEAVVAPGTDRLLQTPLDRYDDLNIPEMRTANRTDKALNIGTRVVADASFMHPINMALERMASRAAIQRFANMASGSGRKLSKKRLLSLGLNEEDAEAVFDQMRKHVGFTEGAITGRKVKALNLDQWDPQTARKFQFALQRWMRRAIQKNDIGDMAQFMTTDVGKIIFQFRSFMMVSWAKQLLHGVRMADFETFSSFTGSMMMGALGYSLMTYANSQGREDQKRYLEERLNPQALANSAFYRSGFSSLLPTAIDTGTMVTGQEPLFAYARTTGLASDIFGNPTFDLIDSLSKSGRAAVAPIVNDDYRFSKQDYREITRALAFQNVTGVRNALEVLGNEMNLPTFSD